jgi:hypothetical protein
MLLPVGTVIPDADLVDNATFNAALADLTIENSRGERAYLLPFLTNFTDNTGDAVTVSRNNYVETVQQKPYNWRYMMNGSFCDYKNVALLTQNSKYDVIFIDAMGSVWGTITTGGIKGYSTFGIVVDNWVQKKPDDIPAYPINFRLLNNEQLISGAAFIASNFQPDPATMGLSSVKLTAGTTANTATHIYVKGTLGCGAISLGETYGATLAATAVWTVNVADTGAVVTISGAAYNAILDEYDLTISSTPAETLIVGMGTPSVLTGSPYNAYIVCETGDKLTTTTP